jgi:Flp pilus assembly protein TadG
MKQIRVHSERRTRFESSRLHQAHSKRRGIETLEAIVALPILLIATLASLEFGILFLVYAAITSAATEGAREAAKGANISEVVAVVEEMLSPYNLTVTSDGDVVVRRQDNFDDDTLPNPNNTGITCTPEGPSPNSLEVKVTVCVDVSDGNAPVPDWLGTFGLSLADRVITISSLAHVE